MLIIGASSVWGLDLYKASVDLSFWGCFAPINVLLRWGCFGGDILFFKMVVFKNKYGNYGNRI